MKHILITLLLLSLALSTAGCFIVVPEAPAPPPTEKPANHVPAAPIDPT